MTTLLAFGTYYLILFVVCYAVADYGQKYLYDEATPMLGLKLAGGAAILALVATWRRPSYDTMFTSDIVWTAMQGAIWFLVFMIILRFHPLHAAAIGVVTMALTVGMASIAVESLTGDVNPAARTQVLPPSKPLRKPAYPSQNPKPPQQGKDAPAVKGLPTSPVVPQPEGAVRK